MINLASPEIWFVTGSQHLYGPEPAAARSPPNSRQIAGALNASPKLPCKIVFKPVLTTARGNRQLCLEANSAPQLRRADPLDAHVFAVEDVDRRPHRAAEAVPASAHAVQSRPAVGRDRHGFHEPQPGRPRRPRGGLHPHAPAAARARSSSATGRTRKCRTASAAWMRAARAWHDWQGAKFCALRRQHAPGRGDRRRQGRRRGAVRLRGQRLRRRRPRRSTSTRSPTPPSTSALRANTRSATTSPPQLRKGGARHASLRDGARIELGLRAFLEEGGFKGFTTTFEDLHGLKQLPGLAVQRLMADGYGFGAEGDWKTCALLRAMKVMGEGLPGGTSFMEDYTYHLEPDGHLVLGAHMLEICESIAAGKPSLEIHPLGIGGKEDPVRLVFDAPAGPAINASHHRPRQPLPAARQRSRRDVAPPAAAQAAGGPRGLGVPARFQDGLRGLDSTPAARITPAFSYSVTTEHLEDFAEIAGIELAVIDAEHRAARLQAGTAQQRNLLSPRAGLSAASRRAAMTASC